MAVVFDRVRPDLGGVPETLLIPLWARAQEQTRSEPLIVDPASEQIVSALDYDFSRFTSKHVDAENFCIRSRVMDSLVSSILKNSAPRHGHRIRSRAGYAIPSARVTLQNAGRRSIFRKSLL